MDGACQDALCSVVQLVRSQRCRGEERMRDVGELGESTLKLWASQASIIANKSIQDKTGWDYFLEWPVSRDTTNGVARPLDKDPFPLTAFVQVKASDKRPGKWPVKLDNWERAVKNPLPVFFLVLEFDSLETCQRAYLNEAWS